MESASYSDMICAFLDGELDISSEESLFTALAAASDLRTEMREHLSIRSAVQSHTEAFMPPVESAQTIFSVVGLEYPMTHKEKTHKIGSLRANFGRIAAFSALFSLITWGIVSYYYENMLGDFILHSRSTSAAYSAVALQSAPIADVWALQTDTEQINRMSHIAGNDKNVFASKAFPTSQHSNSETEVTSAENSGNWAVSEDTDASIVVEPQIIQPVAAAYSSPQRVNSDVFRPVNVYPQFWMQARGIAMMTSSPAPLPNVGISSFDNGAVSGFYKLSGAFSVGAEIGREYYPLQYTGKSEGADVIYRQAAPLLFGGLTAQYSMEPLENMGNVAPYLNLSAGGTEIGQYARATLGIYYPLTQSFGITLGGDLSCVFFQFQGRSFQSQKAGLTYGFAFQF